MKNVTMLFITCCVLLLIGCSPYEPPTNDDNVEVTHDLLLSVPGGVVKTDQVDYTFRIESGNGGYVIQADSTEAKVTLDGLKVTVELLKPEAGIVVVDQKGETAAILIQSSAPSLVPQHYVADTYDVLNETYIVDGVAFGAGGYTAEETYHSSSPCAEVSIGKNDEVKVSTLRNGITDFTLTDRRGTKAQLTVIVSAGGMVKATARANQTTTIESSPDKVVEVMMEGQDSQWNYVDSQGNVYMRGSLFFTGNGKQRTFYVMPTGKGTISITVSDSKNEKSLIVLHIK